MNKITALKQVAFLFFLLIFISACGSPSSGTSTEKTRDVAPVILKLQMPSKSAGQLKALNAPSLPIASIKVEVTGDGKVLASKTVSVLSGDKLFKLTLDLLPGENRTISVFARDEGGVLVSDGQAIVTIAASSRGSAPQIVTVFLKAVAVIFEGSDPLIGSWLNGKTIVTFISDAEYYMAEDFIGGDPNCTSGMEHGIYTHDVLTGAFSVTGNFVDTTADCGLNDPPTNSFSAATITVNNDVLTLSGGIGQPTPELFTRVQSATKPLIGSWYISPDEGGSSGVITFINDSEYFMAENNLLDSAGCGVTPSSGMEHGTYTHNPLTGAFSITGNIVDTSGSCGLNDPQTNPFGSGASLTVNNDTLLLSFIEGDVSKSFLFSRVSAANAVVPPTISINDVSVTEGNAGTVNAVFTVSLSRSSAASVSVDFATANNTALAGSDYVAASGVLTFPPGTTSQTVTVLVNGDPGVEVNESFFVNLSNPVNTILPGPTLLDARGIGTIFNDDAPLPIPITLSINDVSVTEGNAGTVNAIFAVALSQASPDSVTVNFATADGTGSVPSDYANISGVLTFPPGITSQTVAVAVNGDVLVEPNETFFVNLSNPVNATLLDAQGIGTILDDDAPPLPTLSINDVSVTEGNAGTVNAVFTVTLSQASAASVSVFASTTDGTALVDLDYLKNREVFLLFPPGVTSQTVSVPVKGDTLVEPHETFFVNLSAPGFATLLDSQGIGTILNDDTPALNNLSVRVVGLVKETDPIPGIRVLLNHPTTGAFITEKATDANGVADFGDIDVLFGITRASFTVQGAGLDSYINVLPGAYTVTLAPSPGVNPAQATFNVSVTGLPLEVNDVEVQVSQFEGLDDTSSFPVISGTATASDRQALALKADGTFDLFAFGRNTDGDVNLCGYRDALDPTVVNGATLNIPVGTPPVNIPFIVDQNAHLSIDVLRDNSVFEASSFRIGAGSTAGFVPVCDDPKITHYDVEVDLPNTQINPTYLGINLIFDRLPVATDLNNITLPKLSIDSLVRNAATQTLRWTASGLDIAAIDLAGIDLNWTDPLLGAINWEIFVVSTDGSGTATNPGGSLVLPQLPLDPPGTINPFPAMPPASNVSFSLDLVGIESPGIGTAGYDATIELLNANAFNVDKTVLTSTTQIIFSGREGAAVVPAAPPQKLSAGGGHSCALLLDGRIKCWGFNNSGQLGNGTAVFSSPTPVFVSGITSATAVSAGQNHSCALLSDERVQCWGHNRNRELGNGSLTPFARRPVFVSGITSATAVSTGSAHSCTLLSDGRIKCWGANSFGQLGDGTRTAPLPPVVVDGITNATAVSAGDIHNCALLSEGSIHCWGGNAFGQLGNGTRATSSPSPVKVSGITSATAVSAAGSHSCALLSDATVKCWGSNFFGQLGDGTRITSSLPVVVGGITSAKAISVGDDDSCALLSDGKVKCWGNNIDGQLGDGRINFSSPDPVFVSGITSATAVSAGMDKHSCALLSNGRFQCWGNNSGGKLGDGTTTDSFIPVDVIGIP